MEVEQPKNKVDRQDRPGNNKPTFKIGRIPPRKSSVRAPDKQRKRGERQRGASKLNNQMERADEQPIVGGKLN